MFDAPEIIKQIPDIAQIYEKNEQQGKELDEAVEELDRNIFLDTMSEQNVFRWEKILGITATDTDTLEDRRLCVKVRVLEKLPYTYRVMLRKLDTLCPAGYSLAINEQRSEIVVKVALKSKRAVDAVRSMMEDYLPLNISMEVGVKYNTYGILHRFTYGQLNRKYTYKQLREEAME